MRKLVLCSIVAASVAIAGMGCANAPGSPSISFGAPVASGPASGTAVKFKAQPVTLAITNVVRTGPATTTYTVEVATDPNFSTKVLTTTVPETSGSTTTTVTLPNLPASSGNVTYYWRWFATVDGVLSSPTATQNFVIQQQIVVNAPAPSSPASGVVLNETRPSLVTKNAARQGAVGPITYSFQVSTNSAFTQVVASATVPEQSGQTSWAPPVDLPGGTFYWRVRANDSANGENSSFSSVASFAVELFDPRKAIFLNNPSDVATWSETTRITSVDFSTGYMMVDFDKRGQGSGAWPEAGFGSDGGIQYTLGMCFDLSGQWYCSAPIQFWAGREMEASGPADSIGSNWYYDPARWGPMAGHQPQDGERVAVWVGQGNLRSSGNTYRERSNFVIISFGTNYQSK
jgi:hypothetical protein